MVESKGRKRKAKKEDSESGIVDISLSTPWKSSQSVRMSNVAKCRANNVDHPFGQGFVKERTRLHETYIRETARTKRIGLVLAFALILSGALVVLFAPPGRETLSYWMGAALVIFAAGAVGFGRVWGKASRISFGADQDRRELES